MINYKLFRQYFIENISNNEDVIQYYYKDFSGFCSDFEENHKIKEEEYNKDSHMLVLAQLYATIWGYLAWGILLNRDSDDNAEGEAISTLATTISNDIMAIINLLLDGLDYQAMNIVRNLYEISLLILNICIDENKKNIFLKSVNNGRTFEDWKKFFNIKSMLETIANFSKSTELSQFWNVEYKKEYKRLSSFIHNELTYMYVFSYSKPYDKEDVHNHNLGGHYISRVDSILKQVNESIWLLSRLFKSMMDDERRKEFNQRIFGKTNNSLIIFAKNGFNFADYYYLNLCR